MPLQKLQFRSGVNRESTTLANEGGWFECDKIRFRSGFPEKLGGWVQDTGTADATLQPPTGSYWGVCRAMWNWVSLAGNNYLALGTNLKYYIQNGPDGLFYDVTPLRNPAGTAVVSNAFTTINASTTVTVNAPGHGAQTGDFVTISGVGGAVNGIPAAALNREFQLTYLNSNQYNISVSSPATSSGTTGAATFTYQITTGLATYTVATGWGSGAWGGVGFGSATTTLNGGINNSVTSIVLTSATGFTASGTIVVDTESITYSGISTNTLTGCVRGANGTTAAAHLTGAVVTQVTSAFTGWGLGVSSGGVGQQLRLWSHSNYGEDLIFNPRGSALYYWAVNANPNIFDRGVVMAAGATVNGAVMELTTPSLVNFVMVSDASRFVICFGCNDPTGVYATAALDPLQIRWSQQEEYYTWTPAATNQAGDYRISHGSEIITAQQARQEILVFTDSAVYSMQYLGPPYVWGFQLMGDNISIAGPNVVSTANNITYWMGTDKFYMYSGRVETLPCSLRQYVYEDINMLQSYQFFSGTNEGYNEIWWFYCSAGSTVIDKYVIFNHLERTWYYGTMERTFWLDSPLRESPMAAGYNGQLLYHEIGNDDGTTSPATPIVSYCQSSDFDIGDGHNFGLVSRIIPDVTFDGSDVAAPTVTFGVRPRQNPGANYGTSNNPNVVSVDNYISQRYYDVQQFTQYVYVRVRGRQMAFRIGSSALGVAWQLGAPRLDVRPDGRR
jgi:hypothetical protein